MLQILGPALLLGVFVLLWAQHRRIHLVYISGVPEDIYPICFCLLSFSPLLLCDFGNEQSQLSLGNQYLDMASSSHIWMSHWDFLQSVPIRIPKTGGKPDWFPLVCAVSFHHAVVFTKQSGGRWVPRELSHHHYCLFMTRPIPTPSVLWYLRTPQDREVSQIKFNLNFLRCKFELMFHLRISTSRRNVIVGSFDFLNYFSPHLGYHYLSWKVNLLNLQIQGSFSFDRFQWQREM